MQRAACKRYRLTSRPCIVPFAALLPMLLVVFLLGGCGNAHSLILTPMPLALPSPAYPLPLTRENPLPGGGTIALTDNFFSNSRARPDLRVLGMRGLDVDDPYAPDGVETVGASATKDAAILAHFSAGDAGSFFDDRYREGGDIQVVQHFAPYLWHGQRVWYGWLGYTDVNGSVYPVAVLILSHGGQAVDVLFRKKTTNVSVVEQNAAAIFDTIMVP